jgi:menaquinol-cytochrome c reductase iron-sulfur subunit
MGKSYHEPLSTGCGCNSALETRLQGRRSFLAKFTALLAGSVALLTPAAVGIVTFLNPLRQKSRAGGFVRVTTFEAVPEDGSPRKFPVIADRTDAWNFFPNEPIGAVYLRRMDKDQVEALQVVCPHAGCSIMAEKKVSGTIIEKVPDTFFHCPCHAASFDLSGKRLDAASPSPRDMDRLDTEIRDKEVWVKFQKFVTGTVNKIAQG